MKKNLFFVLLVLVASAMSGQLVTFNSPVNVVYGDEADSSEQLSVEWDVTNNTDATITLKTKAIIVQIAPEHKYQYCWGAQCSPWTLNNAALPDEVVLAPGETNSTFYSHFRHYGNAGQTVVRYVWFNAADPSQEVWYEVNYCVNGDCVVVIEEEKQTADISNISPNPMTKTSIITYDFAAVPDGGKIQIHNMVGKLVKEMVIEKKSGALVIEAADFENGIYFCSIQCDGKIFETKRLVVTK